MSTNDIVNELGGKIELLDLDFETLLFKKTSLSATAVIVYCDIEQSLQFKKVSKIYKVYISDNPGLDIDNDKNQITNIDEVLIYCPKEIDSNSLEQRMMKFINIQNKIKKSFIIMGFN